MGGESVGCGRGRGTIYLVLKGETEGVEEDTEEKDKWALMVGLWAGVALGLVAKVTATTF